LARGWRVVSGERNSLNFSIEMGSSYDSYYNHSNHPGRDNYVVSEQPVKTRIELIPRSTQEELKPFICRMRTRINTMVHFLRNAKFFTAVSV
jgi:hypothetical protein